MCLRFWFAISSAVLSLAQSIKVFWDFTGIDDERVVLRKGKTTPKDAR